MEEEKTKSKKGVFIGITYFVLFAIIIVLLFFLAKKDELKTDYVSETEQKQIEKFTSAMKEDYAAASKMELNDAQDYLIDSVYKNLDLYGDNDSVEYMANSLLTEILNSKEDTTKGLVENIENLGTSLVDQIMDGLIGQIPENVVVKNITIKSNTVCNDGDIDAKYCVDKLAAGVYIVDENSDKWAVVVHPVNTSGSIMYRTVGRMYTEQGYNVIAPDLRGAGSSEGSVAMGYLESLDIYDWIKDLNENYKATDRYGVKVAPKTIIVHGISLGAATTLQLATNPDIAAAKQAPYTKNLTQLNVKGFVDDCGYASMSDIITGLLSFGKVNPLTSLLSSLNIDKEEFMSEFSKIVSSLNIQGFEGFDSTTLEGLNEKDINKYFEQFSSTFTDIEEQFKEYEKSNGTTTIPGYDSNTLNDLLDKYGSQINSNIQVPTIPSIPNGSGFIPSNTANTQISGKKDTSEILNAVIGKVLMALAGVGLNDDNYDYYSNSFAEGRHFPEGSKIMIIHGTADTIVPFDNATEVAANASPGVLVHKWDVKNAPHAFIIVGQKKDEYKSLVSKYTNCVTNSTCTSFTK